MGAEWLSHDPVYLIRRDIPDNVPEPRHPNTRNGANRRGIPLAMQGCHATAQGLATFDLEYDVQAFRESLPRIRVIAIEDFDPADFL